MKKLALLICLFSLCNYGCTSKEKSKEHSHKKISKKAKSIESFKPQQNYYAYMSTWPKKLANAKNILIQNIIEPLLQKQENPKYPMGVFLGYNEQKKTTTVYALPRKQIDSYFKILDKKGVLKASDLPAAYKHSELYIARAQNHILFGTDKNIGNLTKSKIWQHFLQHRSFVNIYIDTNKRDKQFLEKISEFNKGIIDYFNTVPKNTLSIDLINKNFEIKLDAELSNISKISKFAANQIITKDSSLKCYIKTDWLNKHFPNWQEILQQNVKEKPFAIDIWKKLYSDTPISI